jgi:hypothetical protein
VVSAYHSTGNEVKYLFRIGNKKLEEIKFACDSIPIAGNNSFYADDIVFGPRDDKGRYTFIEMSKVYYSNAPNQMWRYYYRFNDQGEIIRDRVEKEDFDVARMY